MSNTAKRLHELWAKEDAHKEEIRNRERLEKIVNLAIKAILGGELVEVSLVNRSLLIVSDNASEKFTQADFEEMSQSLEIFTASKYVRRWSQDNSIFYQLQQAFDRKDWHAFYQQHNRHISFETGA